MRRAPRSPPGRGRSTSSTTGPTTSAATGREGQALIEAAADAVGDDPTALTALATATTLLLGDLDRAQYFVDRALALDPNNAWAWTRRGFICVYRGDAEEAITGFERAMRLSPLDPFSFNCFTGMGFAKFADGRFAEAARWTERALREKAGMTWAYRDLAVFLAHAGEEAGAARRSASCWRSRPHVTVSGVGDALRFIEPKLLARYLEGLRMAGLPGVAAMSARADGSRPHRAPSLEHHQLGEVLLADIADEAAALVDDAGEGQAAFLHQFDGELERLAGADRRHVLDHDVDHRRRRPGRLHGADHGVAGEEAAQPPAAVDHREFVLRGADQGVGGGLERRLRPERLEGADHRLVDATRRAASIRPTSPASLGGGEIDEDGDEDEDGVAADQADEAEGEGEALADARGDLGRPRRPRRKASSARSTRPPSIGKAGIRLKSTRKMLTPARRARKPGPGFSICVSVDGSRRAPRTTIRIKAMTTLTSGPAMAMTISSEGFSGMRDRRARPPIGRSVMSGVVMP